MMGPNDGLITPPPKLRKQWIDESPDISLDGHTRIGTDWGAVMDKAIRWGADKELQACCEYIAGPGKWFANPQFRLDELRAARRPKPPSLKEQALEALDRVDQLPTAEDIHTIRRALEALDD